MGDLVTQEREEKVSRYRDGQTFGRPALYSEAVAQRICDTLARGSTRQASALEAGITRETFYTWLQERVDFSDRVARAESQAEVALTETVFSSGTDGATAGDWRPAVEWLKRRRRADYGDTLDIRKLDTDTIRELLMAQQEAIREDSQPLLSGEDVL